MDVLLTHAYYLQEDEKEKEIMRPYPPLGILYISAFLKEKKVDTHLFDATFSSIEAHKEYILKNQPKVIAIYTNLMTKLNVIKLVKWLKNNTATQFTQIILGGPDVTYNYANYLKTGADYIIIGEGEETTFELSNHLLGKTNGSIKEIQGIAYLENNQPVKNDARIKIKNIDDLPFPDRESIDIGQYQNVWKQHHGASTISISTQRGCPYTCKWCSTAVYGQSYRRRSPKLVADEIETIISSYNPDSLWFVDDVFTVSHKWIDGLHEEFIARGIKVAFECITRAERLNDDILGKLKEMGCSKIWIGAESGSQRIIDEMDRRVDVDLVKEMIIKTKSFGIQTGTFIMLGYPKETMDDINKTVQYLKDASPDNFTITVAYPIVGTGLHDQIKNKIITNLNWETSTDRDIDFKRTYSKRFYDFAVPFVVNSVNAHILKSQNKPWVKTFLKSKISGLALYFVK